MNRMYSELIRKKANLEETLMNINAALETEHYTTPFTHKIENQLKAKEFTHATLKMILDDCENRKLGFDPDLTVQLIEQEVHEQFKKVVADAIKDRPVEMLLTARHELELFMLKERKETYGRGLCKVNDELKKIEDELNADPHGELPVTGEYIPEIHSHLPTLEQKVEAVQVLEACAPEVLTDKEIKKVLKVPATKKKATTTKKK